jgi:hypothetical protein
MDSKKYKINEVNAWNGWDPLKQVVLGNVFDPEIFENIGDHKLRDLLQQILYETYEDLMGIKKTLEDLGVDVIQPPRNTLNYLKDNDNVFDLDSNMSGMAGFPKPCLMPRDDFITLGNRILYTTHLRDSAITQNSIFNPKSLDTMFQEEWEQYQSGKIPHGPLKPTESFMQKGMEWNDATFEFWAPAVHRVGNRLIIDQEDWSNLDEVLLERYPEFTSANVTVGGHTDGSMNLPKPGLVICAPWMGPKDFKDTLPGWDVLRIEHPNYMQGENFENWFEDKKITNGKWWHPEAKSNPELVKFVEDWLTNWVGFAEESVFEVNMLSVNEEVILSMNYQKEVHTALKKHGIEPIYCRFRHRNFWDGGLHCLTLDTVRDGGIQDYFK